MRLLLWALLSLAAGLCSSAICCLLWLVIVIPAAPYLPLLCLVGFCLGLNGVAARYYLRQQEYVALVVLVLSTTTTWFVIRAILLCAFLFGFFF